MSKVQSAIACLVFIALLVLINPDIRINIISGVVTWLGGVCVQIIAKEML